MHLVDWFIVAAYLIWVVYDGLKRTKASSAVEGYFLANRSLPWWAVGLTVMATQMSAITLVGTTGQGYADGMRFVQFYFGLPVAMIILSLTLVPFFYRAKVYTAYEYLERRFGPSARVISVIIQVIYRTNVLGNVAYSLFLTFAVLTGWGDSTWYLVVAIAAGAALYTATGGLWAVIVTDVLQFVILAAAVIIIVPLAFAKIGGVGELFERAPENFFNLSTSEFTPLFFIGFGLYNLCFIAGNWAYAQRYTSVKTPRDARKVALLFGCLYTICPVIWMLPPMILRIYNPSLDIEAGEANHA